MSQYRAATDEDLVQGRQLCKQLKAVVPQSNLALTCEEKAEIVKAMGLARGAWYKCPKGDVCC